MNQRDSAGKWSQQMEQNRFSWQLLMQAFRGVFMNKENNSVLKFKNVKAPICKMPSPHAYVREGKGQEELRFLSYNIELELSKKYEPRRADF